MRLKNYLMKRTSLYVFLAALFSSLVTFLICMFFVVSEEQKGIDAGFTLYENSINNFINALKDDVHVLSEFQKYEEVLNNGSQEAIDKVTEIFEKVAIYKKDITGLYLFNDKDESVVCVEKYSLKEKAKKAVIENNSFDYVSVSHFYYDEYTSEYYIFLIYPIYIGDDFYGNFVVCYDSRVFSDIHMFPDNTGIYAFLFATGEGKIPFSIDSGRYGFSNSLEYYEFRTTLEDNAANIDFSADETGNFYLDGDYSSISVEYKYMPKYDLVLLFIKDKNLSFVLSVAVTGLIFFFLLLLVYILIRKNSNIHKSILETSCNDIKNFNVGMLFPKLKKTGIDEFDDYIDKINEYSDEYEKIINSIERISRNMETKIGFFEIVKERDLVIVSSSIKDLFELDEYFNGTSVFTFPINEFLNIQKNMKKERMVANTTVYSFDKKGIKKWLGVYFYDESETKGVITDMTEQVLRYYPELLDKTIDRVSGLFVKSVFEHKVDELISKNDKNDLYCFVTAELVHYRNILGIYGEKIANDYVRKSADVFSEFEGTAIMGRKDGGEFFLFIFEPNNKSEVKKKLENWQQNSLNANFIAPDGKNFKFKFMLGYCYCPLDAESSEKLIKYSSYALYESKKIYKEAIHGFSLANFNRDMFLKSRTKVLDEIIEENKLLYRFQPIINLKDASVYGYECLMRSESDLFPNPKDIIELAVAEGKEHLLEKLNVFNAFNCIRKNKEIFDKRRLFLNLLAGPIFIEDDLRILKEDYGDVRHLIVYEVSTDFYDEQTVIKKCTHLKSIGCRFAVDKFGKTFIDDKTIFDIEPNYIKIDRSLISDVSLKKNKQSRISKILKYAAENNIDVIAVGVETKDELYTLMRLGVVFAQGYYLSLPKLNFIEEIRPEVRKDIFDCKVF